MELKLNLDGRGFEELQGLLTREVEVMTDLYPVEELEQQENWEVFTMLNKCVDQMEDQMLWIEKEYHPESVFRLGREYYQSKQLVEGKVEEVVEEVEDDEEFDLVELDMEISQVDFWDSIKQGHMQVEVRELTRDYGLYVGNVLTSGDYHPEVIQPVEYLGYEMEQGEGMTQMAAVGFLKQFIPLKEALGFVNSHLVWWSK